MAKKDLSKPGRENWVPDDQVSSCMACGCAFGMLNRKHHCRACGGVFCQSCSKFEIKFTAESRQGEAGYKEKKKRACEKCFNSVSESRKRTKEAKQRSDGAAEAVLALQEKMEKDPEMPAEELARIQASLDDLMPQALRLDEEHDKVDQELRETEKALLDVGEEEFAAAAPPTESQKSEANMGAYLVFCSAQQGQMSLVWSRTTVEGALAFAKPTKKVPNFNFARGGRWELVRNIQGDKPAYFRAWIMFVKKCNAFDCSFVDLGATGEAAPIPTVLWLHFADCTVQTVQPNEKFTMEGVDAVAVTHKDNGDLNAPKLDRSLFVEKGARAGHYTLL